MEDLGSRTKRIVFLWEDNFSPERNCVIFSRCHFCVPSDLISILVKWFSSPQTTWREIYFLNFTKNDLYIERRVGLEKRHNWVHSTNNGRQDNPNGADKADFKNNIFLYLSTV